MLLTALVDPAEKSVTTFVRFLILGEMMMSVVLLMVATKENSISA